MAKAGFLGLLMSNPDQAWKNAARKPRTPADPTPKRREKLVAGIENAMKQLKAGEEKPKRGWYSTKGDLARVTIKAGNKIIPVNGREYNVVPKERAVDFYSMALEYAKGNGFDQDMNAVYNASGGTSRGGSGKKRAGWSPERRAAHQARMAALKKT